METKLRTIKKYRSVCVWKEEDMPYTEYQADENGCVRTTDNHRNFESANAVCSRMRIEGTWSVDDDSKMIYPVNAFVESYEEEVSVDSEDYLANKDFNDLTNAYKIKDELKQDMYRFDDLYYHDYDLPKPMQKWDRQTEFNNRVKIDLKPSKRSRRKTKAKKKGAL